MSKASEYAKARMLAEETLKIEAPKLRAVAHVTSIGMLSVAGFVQDPLELARWIVETWGEGPTDRNWAQAGKLYVASTGEITGTLPCGHSPDKIDHEGWIGDTTTRRMWCRVCKRSPAP